MFEIIKEAEDKANEVCKNNAEAYATLCAERDMAEEGLIGPREYGYVLGHIINNYGR